MPKPPKPATDLPVLRMEVRTPGLLRFKADDAAALLTLDYGQEWTPVQDYLLWMYDEGALGDHVECNHAVLSAMWTVWYFDAHPQWGPSERARRKLAISRLWNVINDGLPPDTRTTWHDANEMVQEALIGLGPSWAAGSEVPDLRGVLPPF